jgi:hypothetical protein
MFRTPDDYEILAYNSQLIVEVDGKWKRYKKWRPIWCQLCTQGQLYTLLLSFSRIPCRNSLEFTIFFFLILPFFSNVSNKELHLEKEIQTLEGTLKVKPGYWICRGIEQELWTQSDADLLKKYHPTNTFDGTSWSQAFKKEIITIFIVGSVCVVLFCD